MDSTFKDCSEKLTKLLKNTSSKKISNDQALKLYGFYKQGTIGDVTGPKPGMLDVQGKLKYNSWTALKGVSKSKAQSEYVSYAKKIGLY